MDFIKKLPVLTYWKGKTYNSILFIVNGLIKMIYYEPVKITFDALGLAKVILNVIFQHHGLPDSIINNRSLLFISKFWSLLSYFLGIKQRFSTAFYAQTDS